MEAMDFDALVFNNQDFNTLDNLSRSDANQRMSRQVLQNIQTMQTPLPKGHIPQHVVLPVFNNEPNVPTGAQKGYQFFVIINEQQKGPFTLEQLKGLAIADVINVDTKVWMPGLSDWLDLKTCLGSLGRG